MKTILSLCLFFCLTVFAQAEDSVDKNAFTIHVAKDFIAKGLAPLDAKSFDLVYAKSYNNYFLEDHHVYRKQNTVRKITDFLGKPGFRVFSIQGGKLVRHFYCMTGAPIEEAGFYSVSFEPVETQNHGTLVLNLVKAVKISRVQVDVDAVKAEMVKRLKAKAKDLAGTDMKPLFTKTDPVALTENLLFPGSEYRGLNSPDLVGVSGRKLMFKSMITAVKGEGSAEGSIAVGLFGYITYDLDTHAMDFYFAIIDFSIWVT
jgi:hypothetical protein